jgi:hypothetical protein
MRLILIISFLAASLLSFSQKHKLTKAEKDSLKEISQATMYEDSIVFESGDHIVGKIKELNRGILKLKTKYSKSDFQIKWLKVRAIYSTRKYTFSLNSGQQLFGSIEMDSLRNDIAFITQENGLKRPILFKEIIFIKRIDKKFWDRIKASIDAGYTWTKANNLHQFSIQADVSYFGKKVYFTAGTNVIRSVQDSAANTKRTEGNFALKVYMPKDFFYFISNDLLQNTEQLLDLRSSTATGFGFHYVNSNRMVGAISMGAAWNNEKFTNDSIQRNSIEGFIGVAYEIFNLGDLNIKTNINTMPSFTELGRIRVDFNINVRYKFPFDLYIGGGYTLNYDNKPTTDASKLDFVLQTSIGWSW